MAERFEIVEKTLQMLLDDKKYKTLREILSTMNPGDIAAVFYSMDEERIPSCSGCCPRNWRQRPLLKWRPTPRSC